MKIQKIKFDCGCEGHKDIMGFGIIIDKQCPDFPNCKRELK